MLLHLLFSEITGSEGTTSTDTSVISAFAIGYVAVGAAILTTVAIVVVIATIYCWVKRKRMKSNKSGKKKKPYHTSTEQFMKETDF